MNPEQQRAILTLALFAAFADGEKHAREREEIHRIAESLANEAGTPDLMKLYQDVLLRRTSLEGTAGMLAEAELRQLSYEMAVCVCEADGQVSEAEMRFLDNLKGLLALDAASADRIEHEADAIVQLSAAAAPASAPTAVAPVTAASPVSRRLPPWVALAGLGSPMTLGELTAPFALIPFTTPLAASLTIATATLTH